MSSRERRAGRSLAFVSFLVAYLMAFVSLPAARAATGDVTEFSNGITTSSHPLGITLGPDGNLWFTEFDKDQIGRITPTGHVTEFSDGITAGGGPVGITTGPDGNLWFTEAHAAGNRIGRITPSGQVTEFSNGITASSAPFDITVGPDGNLWFTEPSGNRIGRITPLGSVKEFHTGITSASLPEGIAAGPDGNLWFTEEVGNQVGRISTTGSVTEFSAGITSDSRPGIITPGPDGNLWFTESAQPVSQIARITTSGEVTEFSDGITASSKPTGIVAGPDGNLWFTESSGDKVGRITPSGGVKEFSNGITSGSLSNLITAGPDGNLWFTESADRIGRVQDAAAATTYDRVRDFGFDPKTRRTELGTRVKWMFEGPNPHSVADTTGLNLFHTGSHSFVTYFSKTFNSAGTYSYHCTLHPSLMKGAVAVPIQAAPASGTTATIFTLTWSAVTAPTGFVFDVQIKRPGASSFTNFKAGVTGRKSTFHADRTGTFSFRARLRKTSNGTHSGWSPTLRLDVS